MEANPNGAGVVWETRLNSLPVLTAAGMILSESTDVVAGMGDRVFVYTPADGTYRRAAVIEVGKQVLSLAVGLPGITPDNIIVGTENQILVWGNRQGAISPFWRTELQPGALFTDFALGDLDGDGREEIVAAASGTENIYVYRLEGQAAAELRLELAGIRLVPGRPLQVEIFSRDGENPGIAVLYQRDDSLGLATYTLTERGFAEGPSLENLPGRPGVMAAGNFTPSPGEELAVGGGDGRVRVIEPGERELKIVQATAVLGATISALAAGEMLFSLAVGTPGGYVFFFPFPVQTEPFRAVNINEAVNSLAAGNGRLAAGTTRGGLKVVSVSASGSGTIKYRVKPGDTLWKIARQFGTTVDKISSANNIKNPASVMPGQLIIIPLS